MIPDFSSLDHVFSPLGLLILTGMLLPNFALFLDLERSVIAASKRELDVDAVSEYATSTMLRTALAGLAIIVFALTFYDRETHIALQFIFLFSGIAWIVSVAFLARLIFTLPNKPHNQRDP